MMEKVSFLFCIHNHQPIGNFHNVIEDAYQKAYLPFIEVLKDYPFMRITIHYSGVLWDFFKNAHPEFLKKLKAMVKKGQIEIMSGGYYEPILSVIPDEDKIGQIELLNNTIKSEMGLFPSGLWLAERVWEPHLPKFLFKAGIEYTTIDDYHFKKAGLKEEELNGYYITEDEGYVIKVFPGSEKLRYIIPFHPPEETIKYLSNLREKGRFSAAIFADDGEKFGVWPYTFHSVYEEGWLVRFFDLIKENLSWIEPMPLGEYASKYKPLGRIYLPCSSYMEMDEWSLPTESMIEYGMVIEKLKVYPDGDEIRRFIKGGFWRNFFSKYPESNDLHKRVIHLRKKIKDKTKKFSSIIKNLYKAQCNDGYWHGVFGGLYLPHLRHALYENLIKAEASYDKLRYKKDDWIECERLDLNGDGKEELLLKNENLALLFMCKGGTLVEMDFKPKAFNLLNILTRRREGYHRKILESVEETSGNKLRTIHEIFDSKEQNLDQYLIFDKYRRASFIDHFFEDITDLESFRRQSYKEIGDFIEDDYHVEINNLRKKKKITFSKHGNILIDKGKIPIHLIKNFIVHTQKSLIEVNYQLLNDHELYYVKCLFGIEFNINLLSGDSVDRYYEIDDICLKDRRLRSIGESNFISKVCLIDKYYGLKFFINSSKNFRLWRFPIETVSLSESGFEKIFQGSCLLLFWPIEINRESSFEVNLEFGVEILN